MEKIPRQVLLLILLYVKNGDKINGRTRLEKMLFLLQNQIYTHTSIGGLIDGYNFLPYKFGPFSDEILDDIELLKDMGLIRVRQKNGESVFEITERGKKILDKKIESGDIPKILIEYAENIKKLWNTRNLNDLIKYVYQRYPEYTTRSEIRRRYIY